MLKGHIHQYITSYDSNTPDLLVHPRLSTAGIIHSPADDAKSFNNFSSRVDRVQFQHGFAWLLRIGNPGHGSCHVWFL